ncbi:MAG: Hsp70 family protein [Alphaproteobacteria bacterium]|nr:MAG: Hsp70 family protein [Alphaproteobacteria bacterium]
MDIGIDLGTSNSVVAGIVDGKAKVFRTSDGQDYLPSMIFVDKRGHRLFGRRAHDQAIISPENVASGFKRLMGTSTPIQLPGLDLSLTPEECSSEIIRQLLAQAFTATGSQDVRGAVITIPATFNPMQAEATLSAAHMAGLQNVALLQEPIAAALATMEGSSRSGQFLIYDLGGGTFDLALAQSINGEVSVIDHQGVSMLGGRDFDRMIVNEVVRPWLAEHFDLPKDFQRDPKFRRVIRLAQLAAEKAKIELSTQEKVSIFSSDEEINAHDESGAAIFVDIPFERATYEAMIRDTIDRTVEVARTLLEENGYSHEDIDRVVFIGGPSHTPLIRQRVSDELGIAADLSGDPMTAVAVGAAYFCESREWKSSGTSAPKKSEAVREADIGQGSQSFHVSFEHTARTVEDRAAIRVRIPGGRKAQHDCWLQLTDSARDWQSARLRVEDEMVIAVPLPQIGSYVFQPHLTDETERSIDGPSIEPIEIMRVVAATAGIPATHTIAVKVRESSDSPRNRLHPLVKKNTVLPSEGDQSFRLVRPVRAGEAGHVAFELYQLEYPEKVELNLCIGSLRIAGEDLPSGTHLKEGDIITFHWRLSDSGVLQANVSLPSMDGQPAISLRAPRFYSPQAGRVSFDPENGLRFAEAVLAQAEEEWGELSAALGPQGGHDLELLRLRLEDQGDQLREGSQEPEQIRQVSEEARFIRQDLARLAYRHRDITLKRRLGRMQAAFNRLARSFARPQEATMFDRCAGRVQQSLNEDDKQSLDEAESLLETMRELFFNAAWRDDAYVEGWYRRLAGRPWLFPNQEEFTELVIEGGEMLTRSDRMALRHLVSRMLDQRIDLEVAPTTSEPAGLMATTA